MNITLLREIQQVIASRPEEFDINSWHAHGSCQTTHCIGGWAQVLTGAPQNRHANEMAELLGLDFVIDEEAAEFSIGDEIHVTDNCQAGKLFYHSNWPDEFLSCGEDDCEDHPYRNNTEAAIAFIDFFIAMNGVT